MEPCCSFRRVTPSNHHSMVRNTHPTHGGVLHVSAGKFGTLPEHHHCALPKMQPRNGGVLHSTVEKFWIFPGHYSRAVGKAHRVNAR